MIALSHPRQEHIEKRRIAADPVAETPGGAFAGPNLQDRRSDANEPKRGWTQEHGLPAVETNSLGMRLVLVVPGEFWMGSDSARSPDAERPLHLVRITRPFYCGVNEVTAGEFGRFVSETGYETTAEAQHRPGGDWRRPPGFSQSDRHPAVCLSWRDAEAFCRWLSEKETATYRLPTEAEWEYACGTTAEAADTGRQAWYAANSQGRTHRVGLLEPNVLGLSDMLGNAREWCFDGPCRYDVVAAADPLGTTDGPRVLRGGDWSRDEVPRAGARSWSEPDQADATTGFRVVREIGGDSQP
jgi:formylglycine-generating enzyme required for sulfatase activity